MAEGSPDPNDRDRIRLLAVMRRAMRAAQKAVLNPPGGTDNARQFNASRAAAQLRDLNKQLLVMNAEANLVMSDAVRESYRRGIVDAERLMRKVGLVNRDLPIQGALMGADTRRAAVLVRNAQSKIDATFQSVSNVAGRAIREARALGLDNRRLRTVLAGGTITGESQLTVQKVRKLMKQIAIGGFVEVPARGGQIYRYKPDYYADLVYQTMNAEAAEKAEHERMITKGAFYVRIIGSNSLNFCTAFVNKVFYIGPGVDPSGRYPHYRTLPRGGAPFHPHCTKRSVPFNPGLASEQALKDALPDDRTRQLLGKDPIEAQKAFQQQQAEAKVETPPAVEPAPPDVRTQARDARRQLREIAEATAVTEQRLAAERLQLTDQLARAAAADDLAHLDELAPRWSKVVQEENQLAEQRRKAARDVLRVENPTKTTLATTLTGTRRKTVEAGVEELSKLVDQRLLPEVRIVARPPEKGRGGRSYYRGGAIYMTSTAPVDVVIHEIGHLIEDASPTLHRAAMIFLQRRTDGEPLVSLRQLTRLRYRPNERARPDKFFDPYVGKDYGGQYSEVISMGLQYMWADPIKFAAQDPDFFEFIYRIMRGDFRD